jgi:glucose-6-phosphate isomerase
MTNLPFAFELQLPYGTPVPHDKHIVRLLSSMQGQFLNQRAYEAMLARDDTLLYEVYEVSGSATANELVVGTSVVHPGKVGDEYFMTKGHFHAVLDVAEMYHCLAGEGLMVMENPEGDWQVADLRPGVVLYVAPRWAHRSVNTRLDRDLITLFAYPGHAGHDYGSIERQGFRKLVLEREGRPVILDNPRWLPPDQR